MLTISGKQRRSLERRAAWLITVTVLSMRWLGFRRTYRWLSASITLFAREFEGDSSTCVQQVTAALEAANKRRALFIADCLPKSMALWWLLSTAGLNAELKLGARLLGGSFQAHAWVELEGRPVNESANVGTVYSPFELPAQKRRPLR